MNKFPRSFSAILLFVFIAAGCASTQATKEPPVFYPEPPELAHVQYLTSFTSSMDIEPKRSSFERFVTGTKDVVKRLDKPYGVGIYGNKIYVCDNSSAQNILRYKTITGTPATVKPW